MNEHLDLDALADLLAEVDGTDRSHLDTCAACRARLAELEAALPAVTASLASLAALELPTEPTDLQARLDAALAAEAAGAGARTQPAADVLPLPGRARARWMPALAAVAAAAVAVTGGALLLQGGDDAGTTADRPPYVTSATGTNYTKATLQGALPGLLSGRAVASDSGAGTTGGSAQSPRSSTAGSPEALVGSAADPLATLRTTAGLASCLSAVLDPADDELPLALDYAAFEGQPALVIVLRTPKQDKADVYVVGAGCAQADAQLLYFSRLTKP